KPESVHPRQIAMAAQEADSAPPTIRNIDPPMLTDAAFVVGTPGYMAPESWRGRPTPQSDVYSLGVLLFELCAGRTPYADVAPHALSFAVQRHDAPLLTDVVPTVGPKLATIVARCLSRDPGARYASAEELHQALERAGPGQGEPPTGRRAPRSRKTTTVA